MRSKFRQISKCFGRQISVVLKMVCICCRYEVNCLAWFSSNFGPAQSSRALKFNNVRFEIVDVSGYWLANVNSSCISEHFMLLHSDLLALNFRSSVAVASSGFTLHNGQKSPILTNMWSCSWFHDWNISPQIPCKTRWLPINWTEIRI